MKNKNRRFVCVSRHGERMMRLAAAAVLSASCPLENGNYVYGILDS